MSPTITIITRHRDRPSRYLARARDSILDQEYNDWRWVVVSAAPTEVAEQVLGERRVELTGRAQIVIGGEPGSIGRLANVGATLASDDGAIALLDDDDTWAPDFLSRMARAYEEMGPQNAGVVCWTEFVDEVDDGHTLTELSRHRRKSDPATLSLRKLARANRFASNALLVRASAWRAIGGRDETLTKLEDWDFNLRLLERFELTVVPEALARYHRRPDALVGPVANLVRRDPGAAERSRARIIDKYLHPDQALERPGLGRMLAAAAPSPIEERVGGAGPH